MNTGPEALVLTGYGINCDYETSEACGLAGFSPRRVHINDVLDSGRSLFDSKLIVFPGGFSFGDDLGSGIAFSAKVRFSVTNDGEKLYDLLMEYVHRDGLVLGICNGFQILVRLGMIPAVDNVYGRQVVTLAPNREGYFINRWVKLKAEKGPPGIFTAGLDILDLPVRHGEGRFVSSNGEMMKSIVDQNLVSLRYCDKDGLPAEEFPDNPNGSEESVAGICDPTGRIFGLMPHPEAAVSFYQYPDWTKRKEDTARKGIEHPLTGDGFFIFKNAYNYIE
jgi:phosphoribosylformylglycinamidine (FGAM) synthase-like amidotransferase family enzyme